MKCGTDCYPQSKPICQHSSGLIVQYFRSLCPITYMWYPHTLPRTRFLLHCTQETGPCVLPYNVWLLLLTFSWLLQQMSFTSMLFPQSPLKLLRFLPSTCPSFLYPWGCVSYYHPSPAKSMPLHSTLLHCNLFSHPLSIWPIYVVCIIAIC